MTIRNKDGNVYKLQGPNKLSKNQEIWDVKKLIFHNFYWQDILSNIKNPETKEIVEEKIQEYKIKEELIEEKIQENKTEEQPKIEKTFDLPILKYKVLMHCTPAKIKKNIDPLYGDVKIKITYENKIIFPCVLISSEDLILEFWTSDPNQTITEKSVVYPFLYEVYNEETKRYDNIPYDDRRWWKIIEKTQKDNGWIFKAMPSDFQPDFSD